MELVFEILGRGHRQNTLYKSAGPQVTLGRAWDNDIILQDPQVDPHHARISADSDSGQLIVEDCDSTNGTWIEGRSREQVMGRAVIHSGSEIVLGRSRLRVFDLEHPVDPTLAPTQSERWSARIGHIGAVLPIMLLSLTLVQLLGYLDSYAEFNPQESLKGMLTMLIVGFVWASGWSLIGRVTRHEPNFGTHLSLAFLFFASMAVLEHFNEILTFNHLSLIGHQLMDATLTLLVAALFLNATLFVAAPLGRRLRQFSAVGVTAVVVLVMFVLPIFEEPTGRGGALAPQVVTLTRPDIFRVRSGTTIDDFLADAEALYEPREE